MVTKNKFFNFPARLMVDLSGSRSSRDGVTMWVKGRPIQF